MEDNKLNRFLFREGESIEYCASLDAIKVGIMSIAAGAGASFLTISLARFLANTRKVCPSVIELGRQSIYDSIGMDKRFAGREFFPFFLRVKDNVTIRGQKNMDEGINWIIRSPDERKLNISIDQKQRLISSTGSDPLLCDLSGANSDLLILIKKMDRLIVVIDPLPAKMLEGYEILQELKKMESSGMSVLYIINKFNNGVNRREMLNFLKIKKPIYIPLINSEFIYTAEYNCKIPYSIGNVKTQIQEPLRDITIRLKLQD